MNDWDQLLSFLQRPANDQTSLLHTALFAFSAIVLSLLLALMVCWVYQRTYKGLQYSRTFVFSLALFPCITSIVVMVIGGSLVRAFAALGALSLIRFRTAIKDTVDLAYVFLSITIGVCIGSGNFIIGVVTTFTLLTLIWILSRIHFGSYYAYEYILRLVINSEGSAETRHRAVLNRHTKKAVLLNLNTGPSNGHVELIYNIKLNSDDDNQVLVRDLARRGGVLRPLLAEGFYAFQVF
jgi:uncharacterized membrane protein YhiD involved in acid resistance